MLISLSLLGTIFFFKTCPPSFYKMSPWSRLGTLNNIPSRNAGRRHKHCAHICTQKHACFQFDKLYHTNRTVRHKQVLSAMWMASPKFTVSKRVLKSTLLWLWGKKNLQGWTNNIPPHPYSSKKKKKFR